MTLIGLGFSNTIVYDNIVVSTTGASSVLHTWTLGASVFNYDGDSVAFEYIGTMGGGAATGFTLLVGEIEIFSDASLETGPGMPYRITGKFARKSSSQLTAYTEFVLDGNYTQSVYTDMETAFDTPKNVVLSGGDAGTEAAMYLRMVHAIFNEHPH